MTKADDTYQSVCELMGEGMSRTDAFRKLAAETGTKYDSVRGAFYTGKLNAEGGTSRTRTRRRETTPEAALADARAALERSIASIDVEVEAARERAAEAVAEAEALENSAEQRKALIAERLEALK